MNTYTIDCEAGEFTFEHVTFHEREQMEEIKLNGRIYFYEPGDSYLYTALDGGESSNLGEVFNYGVLVPGEVA
jgi:hypothetical protein